MSLLKLLCGVTHPLFCQDIEPSPRVFVPRVFNIKTVKTFSSLTVFSFISFFPDNLRGYLFVYALASSEENQTPFTVEGAGIRLWYLWDYKNRRDSLSRDSRLL